MDANLFYKRDVILYASVGGSFDALWKEIRVILKNPDLSVILMRNRDLFIHTLQLQLFTKTAVII